MDRTDSPETSPSTARPTGLGLLVAATRPGFLVTAVVPVLIGLGAASRVSPLDAGSAALTLAGAVLAHAGANVLNDVHDDRAGCDAINTDRIAPFTGGSRLIQDDAISAGTMLTLGWTLLAVAALIGGLLTLLAGPALLVIGFAGLLVGHAYSAPPLRLCARGMGEAAVALGFGVLIPLGTAWVQLGRFEPIVLAAGLPFAAMVAAILYINQFPDFRADAATHKRNWVVRLGPRAARPGFPLLWVGGYGLLVAATLAELLPAAALLGLLPLPLHAFATRVLWRYFETPAALRPAIVATLAAGLGSGILIAIGCAFG